MQPIMMHAGPPKIRGNMKMVNLNLFKNVEEEEDQFVAVPFLKCNSYNMK